MQRRIHTHLILLTSFFVLTIIPSNILAQGTVGTIRGKITDSSTGLPLPAVNVHVLEVDGTMTTMGGLTDAEGEYVIINVPPGRYTIRASMMGFSIVEAEDLLVTVNVSTMQHFQLTQTVLDVGETITVTAERDVIQRDIAGTQQHYSFEEMERMPVRSTSDILNIQTNSLMIRDSGVDDIAGYYYRGQEQLHMRGGRNAEVAFLIDGMQVTNLVFGGQAANVSPFSLSAMVIMAGGMSAEFGNAMSGVVNMITREGGRQFDANIEVLSSELTGFMQDDVRDLTSTQGYLGGPVPLIDNLTFFISGSASTQRGRLIHKDDIVYDTTPESSPDTLNIDYHPINPYLQFGPDGREIRALDLYSGWSGDGFDNLWNGMLSIAWKPSPSMKLTTAGQKNGRLRYPSIFGGRFSSFYGATRELQDACVWGIPVEGGDIANEVDLISDTGLCEFENELNVHTENNSRYSFIWTHQLNQSTFYSIRGSAYNYRRNMRIKRWINEDGYHSARDFFYTQGDTLWTPDDEMIQVSLHPTRYNIYDPDARRYGYTRVNFLSDGIAAGGSAAYYTNHYDDTFTLKTDITSQVTTHHQVRSGVQYNWLIIDQLDIQHPEIEIPYRTDYYKTPWELGVYLQDKIEYDFVVVNVGVRYDAGSAGETSWWTDPYDPRHPDDPDTIIEEPFNPEMAPIRAGKLRSQFSPRVGISHPVTDRTVLYFNYGHFFQNPIYRNLFLGAGGGSAFLEYGASLIGNPDLDSEKTISYEFGLKHQFTEYYGLEVTLWAKDTSNMVSSVTVPEFYQGIMNPYSYTVFMNYDYANSTGIDLTIIKRFSHFWSARANYSYMQARCNRDDPWQGYRNQETMEDSPKRPRPLHWEVPHRFNFSAAVSIPAGSGPAIFGLRPLERITASVTYAASAGMPYTPTTKEHALELNSGRRPWTYQCDLKIYRDFTLFGFKCSLLADVRNLFDRENVSAVFSRTGTPDDPGAGATRASEHYDRSYYYMTPRVINVGMRIYF